MNIGDRVSVEFVGVIEQISHNFKGDLIVSVNPGSEYSTVSGVSVGACTPIGKAEEVPLVAPDGSY